MKQVVALAVVLMCCEMQFAAEPVSLLEFKMWGGTSKVYKLYLCTGFVNGLLAGAAQPWRGDATPGRQLLICLLDGEYHPGDDQAIAMIDKYYQDHPERWDISLGRAIVEALTVEKGPCARFKEAKPPK